MAKIDLKQKLPGFLGKNIKIFWDRQRTKEEATLGEAIINILSTERVLNESLSGYKEVNKIRESR